MNIKDIKKYLSRKKEAGPTARVKIPKDLNKELILLQNELYDDGAPSKEDLLVAIARCHFNLPFGK